MLTILKTFLFLSVFSICIFSNKVYTQTQTKISLNLEKVSLETFFKEIQNKSEYVFFYKDAILNSKFKITIKIKNALITSILDQAFSKSDLSYKIDESQVTVLRRAISGEKGTVTGVVRDNFGNLLPGTSILEKGSTNGTSSDFEGNYTLTVSNLSGFLTISNLGYKPQEISINNRTKIEITLEEDILKLDEIVVTALGIKREKKALGYAISEVKAENMAKTTDNSFVNSLSGMVSGVSITSGNTGLSGSSRVVIRGNAEIGSNNQPLYIVDGIPIDNTSLGGAGQNGGYDLGDGISGINPNDIENVSILKGPSSTALYGSRASNGVILITTKSGKGKKGFGVEINSTVDFIDISRYYDSFQNKYGQGFDGVMPTSFITSSSSSISSWGALLDPNKEIEIFDGSSKPYAYVPNNIQSFFRTGVSRTNDLVITAGNEDRNLRFSVGSKIVDDIIPNSNLERTTFSIRGISKLGKKATIDSKITYTVEEVNNRPALGDLPNNVGLAIFSLAPNLDQAWLKNYKDENNNYREWNGDQFRINPYWSINETSNTSQKNRVLGFVKFKYPFSDYFRIETSVGSDYYNFNFTEFLRWGTPSLVQGRMIERNTTVQETNLDFMARYSRRFLDKKVFVLFSVGGNQRHNHWKTLEFTGNDQIIREQGLKSIINYKQTLATQPQDLRKQVNGIFGIAHFSYDEKFYIDFTLRNDWSSTLPKDNNSFMYGSVTSSFIFSEALGLQSENFNFGKLRVSYAEVGGDTEPYQLNQTYGLQSFIHLGKSLGGISQNFRTNQNLRPTRTKGFETGLELKFLKNRVSFDATWFVQNTFDQILNVSIANSGGYFGVKDNAGHIQNKGLEMSLSTDIIKDLNHFNWNVNVNFTTLDNSIIALHPNSPRQILGRARWSDAIIASEEGGAFGAIIGKKFLRDKSGNIIHNSNGFPTYTSEFEEIGQGVHDWFGGLSNEISYKNWTLNFLIDVKMGAAIYSMTNANAYQRGIHVGSLEGREEWYNKTGGFIGKGVVNVGTEENPNYVENNIPVNPREYWQALFNETPEPFVYDASYVKLRNINLRYNFPKKLTDKLKIKNASISLNAQNVWNIYDNVPNVDPEANYNNSNGQGLEYGSLPQRFFWGMNVNINF